MVYREDRSRMSKIRNNVILIKSLQQDIREVGDLNSRLSNALLLLLLITIYSQRILPHALSRVGFYVAHS